MSIIPTSSSWTGWWSSIVAESDKRCELEKEKLRAPENPPPPSTSGSTFFSISAVQENLEQIDQEARRRLETKSAQYVPNQPDLSKPVASIIEKTSTLAEPVEPEDQKSSACSFFSTSLNTVNKLCIETEQEAERRFEEENRQASLFSIGTDLLTSAIDLVKGATNLAKEATSRPIVIGGTDINYYSLNVEKISEDFQKEMTSRVAAVRKDSLSLEELDIINGEFVEEASFIMESPEIGLSESQEISKSGKEKIEDEIQAFCKPLIAHLTFHLLHEVIAGQKIVPDEQREQLYQTMTRLAIEDSARDDPLWDIYYEHLGKNLSGFAYIKVRVFYLLFYSLSDFIPTLIRECSKHATGTLYGILTDEKQLDQHISTALERAENYLTRLNSSISKFGKKNGKGGNVDTYKKAVVHTMFGENLDGTLEELIKRASRKAIDLFFPKIIFCELGKTSSSVPLRWAGRKISNCVNFAMQCILTLFLKKIVIPIVLRSILKKWLSEDPNDIYLLKYKLQKAILEHIQKMNQSLDQPKEKKGELSIEVSNSGKLETIASELTKILTIPSEESAEAIRSHYENISLERKGRESTLKKGILKAGHVIIGTLHNQDLFEESLTKMLSSSKKTLLGSMERSHPKSFSSLKSAYHREKRELRKETDKLALALTDEMIDDVIGSDLEAFDQRTGRIQEKIQYKIEWLAISLASLTSEIESIMNLENSLVHEPDFPSGTALIHMDNFWTYIKELIQQMDIQGLAKQTRAMPSALKKGLDGALQPLRKNTLEIIHLAEKFDQMHRNYHLYLTLKRELGNSLDCLKNIRDRLQGGDGSLEDSFSYIPVCTGKAFRLLRNLPNFIPEKDQEEIKNQEQLLLERLRGIDDREIIISELNSLVEQSGPVYQLVLFMQRQSLRPFNSEKARNDIRSIFEKTQIPHDLMTLIDQMLRFTSRADDSDWDKLEPIILAQLPQNSPLQEKFSEAFEDWRELKRGKILFEPKNWEEKKRNFLQELRRNRLPLQQAASLLDQIEGFLREDSILNARWNQFCERIEQARDSHITKSRESKKLYEREASQFYDQIGFYINQAEKHQNTLHFQLTAQIPEIKSKLNIIEILAKNLRMKTPYSSEVTLTSAGAVIGTAGSILTAILGIPLWATVTVGAVIGGLLARNIRPIGRAYSKKRIIPHVHELLGKAQKEGLQLHTRQVIAFSLLDAFGD